MFRLINMEVSQAGCETIVNALCSPAVSQTAGWWLLLAWELQKTEKPARLFSGGVITPQAHDEVKSGISLGTGENREAG